MDLIHIAELSLQMLGYYLAMAIANRLFEPRRRQRTLVLVALAETGLTIVLQQLVIGSSLESPLRLVTMLLTYAPFLLLYSRNCWLRIVCYGSMLIMFNGFALLASSWMISMATGTMQMSIDTASDAIQLAGVFMEMAITLVLLYATSGFLRRSNLDREINWLGYSLFMFSQYALIFLCILLEYANPNLVPGQMNILIICVGMCVAADIMLFLTIKRNIKAVHAELENETLRQLQSMQQRHGLELQEQHRQASIQRHDVVNHLHTLHILLDRDAAKAKAYLDELIDAHSEQVQAVFCPNAALNAAVFIKSLMANEAGLRLHVDLKLPGDLPIDDPDLVGIVTNMLDNAIAACSALLVPEPPEIHLSASVQSGHLRIRCTNPCSAPVQFDHGLPVRPRNAGQGYGARSILDTAHKYAGDAQFQQEDSAFTAAVILPISRA